MGVILDRPREPEEGEGDDDGADVGQGESVFGFRVAFIFRGEAVVDGVDFGDDEPDGEEESCAGAEV